MKERLSEEWWEREREKLEKKYKVKFKGERRFISREYLQYLKGQKLEERNWYITLCKFFRKISVIPPDRNTYIKLDNAIKLLDWKIRPNECITVGIFGFLITLIPALLSISMKLPLILKFLSIIVPFIVLYYLIYYPHLKALEKVLRSSEDLIFSVLYMIIYTYSSPNLEGAVLFSALNLQGPISDDLKKVIWDVEIGKYSSMEEALSDYVSKWEPYNKDFLQAIQLIRASIIESSEERRNEFLDAASNTILMGTRERMKHYSQELKLPVTMLNGLGILLPILVMIALPLLSIFAGNAINAYYIILFYNFLIPVIVYFFMVNVLIKRPPTTSVRPLEEGDMPKSGYMKFGNLEFSAVPLSVLIFILLGGFNIYYYIINGFKSTEPTFSNLMRSLSIIFALSFAIAFYMYFGHNRRLKKQVEIEEIEEEFPNALFELGHKLIEGMPIEVSLDSSIRSMRNLKISQFFRIISNNIKKGGMTFREAIFDRTYGALRKYPSKLIDAVMKAVIEASEKGTEITSRTMITISRYLQNLHRTQENINDLMEETTTTMKFIGYILAPVIAGVAVSMTQIMGFVLKIMAEKFGEINQYQSGDSLLSTGKILEGLINFKEIVPPDLLQLIIGLYIIEILIIIGMFYSRIKVGINKDFERVFTAKLLFVGIIVYGITSVIVGLLFGGILQNIF